MSTARNYLLDGPALFAPERKAALAAIMGAALLADVVAGLERGDAIRLLLARGHNMLDVMLCVDDAWHWAMQEIVAKEMGEG